MLTEEQIKNLKDGDIIYLNHYPLTFNDVSDDLNTISARDDASTCGEGDLCWFTRQYLTLQPKYDPCRLFRKGDKVRIVEWNGRKLNDDVDMPDIVEVEYDERPGARDVSVFWKGYGIWGKAHMPQCFLELVTPVEELEPYKVVDAHTHWDVADKNMKTVVTYNKAYHPNALAAAEAECDRLNEEWRKEQNNDRS